MATGRLPDPNTAPVTAKGDLYTYSTVPAKLAVGSNGETLVADSSATTGLRWSAGNPQGNPVINSAFQIWQRATSIAGTTTPIYTADRWLTNANSSFTISRQTTNDTTNLPFIQYCLRFQRNAGSTNTTNVSIGNNFETINSIPYAGKTVTYSFYARKGANFSGGSSQILAALITGTGTDQAYQSGTYTGAAFTLNYPTLTTTWQRFSYTTTLPTNTNELNFYFDFNTPSGTAGAADFYEITGVQLDVGSVALPFRTYAATLAGELAACQRYFFAFLPSSSDANRYIGTGTALSSSFLKSGVQFPVTMRTTPTLVAASGTDYYRFQAGDGGGGTANDDFNSFTISQPHTNASGLQNSTEIATVQNRAGTVFTNSTSATVAFSAEL